MLRSSRLWHCALVSVMVVSAVHAEDTPPKHAKLKVLLVTGGGYHDYKKLAPLLTEKISELVNVQFDVNWDAKILKDPKFGEGYDAIVYDMCYTPKDSGTDNFSAALETTKNGKPTVVLHCAMHCWRPNDDWRALTGMATQVHDPYQAFSVEKDAKAKDHLILKTWPDEWKTVGDELYNTIEMKSTATPLLRSLSPKTKKEHVVAWVNQYGKGRVFGTTLGHDMNTAADGDYQRLVAFGLLWACDKLGPSGKPMQGYEGPGPKSTTKKTPK